jgi:hypothetical protein
MANPVMPLTPAERQLVDRLNATSTRAKVLDELKKNLQIAIEIELATIPIYLYTYYSIVRNATSGEDVDPVQSYANMAGAAIMSVAVEEMLHMSLGCNILFAMGVEPQLYRKAPGTYPTPLPFHNKKGPKGPDGDTRVLIPLGKLGFMQLWHFLQIEYPEQWNVPPQDRDWDTIGQFYSYIRCQMSTKFITDADFQHGEARQAIQPDYYSPNNIDTVFPPGKFDPWKPAPPGPMPAWAKQDPYPSGTDAALFTDSDDSHAGPTQLVTVRSRQQAFEAITTICDQGEGYPVRNVGPDEHDDTPGNFELSHYMKFLVLQAQFQPYQGTTEQLPKVPPPPKPQKPTMSDAGLLAAGMVIDFPDNPTTAGYPLELQPIARFCSACFQYMLIMSETVYRVPPDKQKLFFNEGLHRSMIWILDKYARTIRNIPLGNGKYMAPVFENVDLGPRQTSFLRLVAFAADAIKRADEIAKRDPSLADVMGNVSYYAKLAIEGDKRLPDVGRYWLA